MSIQHPIIDDPELGRLTRAETTLDDGGVVTHDWYAGTVTLADQDVELMIDGTTPEGVQKLLPRIRAVIADLANIRRQASDAIRAHFSDTEPTAAELDEAAEDLLLEAVEATADETVLHFVDSCGQHFPEECWPAAHLDAHGVVTTVTVEA
ncbi:hypothetical protein FM104_11350 [Microbacterium esteraromaticum]|uniref:DUF2262 domain-containing protein n=1 Tax=Microbacterium esteraromaticum TaxID=57043 RepID=A0A1R4KAB2_9MICO|nr:hypothetical protein [Microbacterium esteraromaticum]SJN41351.1 hypothetical protein FM104_11350 [Microbacterium esteraromaticum]